MYETDQLYSPDFKIYVGLVGLEVLGGEVSELQALLQEPLCRRDETGHRHGDPQKVHTLFPVVTIHVCGRIKEEEEMINTDASFRFSCCLVHRVDEDSALW